MYKNIINAVEKESLPPIQEIIDSIDEFNVFTHYIGSSPLPNVKYKSPFNVDKTPSFRFYSKDNKIRFKCFSSGKGGDCVDLVRELYNLTYTEAIYRIYKDLKNNTYSEVSRADKVSTFTESDCEIQFKRQDFTDVDVAYWGAFHIQISTLIYFGVSSCKELWLFGKMWNRYHRNDPMYIYNINSRFKVYRPLSNKENKFRSNTIRGISIQGFFQLTYTTDICFITSSLKDIMCLYEINFEAVALSSESEIPSVALIAYLKSKFKHVILFYDNDEAGLKAATYHSQLHNIPFIHVDGNDKDPSDYSKNNNPTMLLEHINSKISIYE